MLGECQSLALKELCKLVFWDGYGSIQFNVGYFFYKFTSRHDLSPTMFFGWSDSICIRFASEDLWNLLWKRYAVYLANIQYRDPNKHPNIRNRFSTHLFSIANQTELITFFILFGLLPVKWRLTSNFFSILKCKKRIYI